MRLNLFPKFLILFAGLFFMVNSQTMAQAWLDDLNAAMDASNKGDFETAIVYFEKALPGIKQQFGEGKYYALCVNYLAQFYEYVGRYDRSEQLFLEAIAKVSIGENNLDYAEIIGNLAWLYADIHQNEKAEELFLKSASVIQSQIGEINPEYGNVICDLGDLYTSMGQYEKAEDLYLKGAYVTKTALGDTSEDYAGCLMDLGLLYDRRYEYKKAEEKYLEAIAIRKKVWGEKNALYATSLGCLARLYMHVEEFDKAEPIMLKVLELEKQSMGETHPVYASSLHNMGALYTDMKKYDKAEQYYNQSLSVTKIAQGENHQQYGITLNSMGGLYTSMGDMEKAEKCFLESIRILKNAVGDLHPDYEISVSNMGNFYMVQHQYEKAAPWFKETEDIVRRNLENSFEFLSETEKEKYSAKTSYHFTLCQSFYYNYYVQNSSVGKSSFNIQLTTSGMILNSSNKTRLAIANSGDTALIRLNEKWKAIKITIAQQYSKPLDERNPKLKIWEDEANALEKEITKRSSEFAKSQNSTPLQWNDIQRKLKPNEAAVEYIAFDYHNGNNWTDSTLYIAVVLTRNDNIPTYIPLFEEKQLSGLLRGDTLRTFANLLYTDAQVRTVENEISYGDSLYQLVWKPLEPSLNNITTVYYAPSGLLHNLNLDAIPDKENHVLSDKYTLQRLTSTSHILQKESSFSPKSASLFGGINYEVEESELKKLVNHHQDKRNKIIAFSDTRSIEDTASRSGFNYLPGSKTEVDNISYLLTKSQITTHVYSENKGSEEAVKNLDDKNSPSIIHFSTHGFFFSDRETRKHITTSKSESKEPVFKYSDNPLFRSGLIMAGADFVWRGNPPIEGIEDGILTAYEISDLYLPNTKLVVMSACETGLGEIKGSEGVYGLQRAFKKAGTEYIIMTLWKVLDKETSEFMTLFYENLIDKKSIPDAFKSAQENMKSKYRTEPYKWAAFVLIK